MNAVILKHNIDIRFHHPSGADRTRTFKFQRIDADVTDNFKEEVSEAELKRRPPMP